jgi:hypothetical protein
MVQCVSDAKKLAETAPETFERVKAGTLNLQQAKREAKAEVAQRDPSTEKSRPRLENPPRARRRGRTRARTLINDLSPGHDLRG